MKRTKRTVAAILAALVASASLSSCFTVRVIDPHPRTEKKVIIKKNTGKKTIIKKKKKSNAKNQILPSTGGIAN